MPSLVSHEVNQVVKSANDAADGTGAASLTSDVKAVTVIVDETLASDKTARATIVLTVDDVAKTQAAVANTVFNPPGALSEDDLDSHDVFVTYQAGLIDNLKINYPTT